MKKRLVFGLILLLLFDFVQSQDQQSKEKAQQDQRGTKKQPLVIQGIPPIKTDSETRAEREYRDSQTSIGSSIGKTLDGLEKETERTTSLTFLLFVVAFIQAGLFLWQLILISRSAKDTKGLAEAARLQSRALVAEKLPVVLWTNFKLVEFDALDQPAVDPVPAGPIPTVCRPVFELQNMGPTRIVSLYYALKWEITKELAKQPHFGGMLWDGLLVKQDQKRSFTTGVPIKLTSEERERLDSGDTQLWAYGFVYYNDFMDESHQIGAIVKWDAVRGFVQVVRENYSYHRHEKIYTKEYRQAEGNEAPIRT